MDLAPKLIAHDATNESDILKCVIASAIIYRNGGITICSGNNKIHTFPRDIRETSETRETVRKNPKASLVGEQVFNNDSNA